MHFDLKCTIGGAALIIYHFFFLHCKKSPRRAPSLSTLISLFSNWNSLIRTCFVFFFFNRTEILFVDVCQLSKCPSGFVCSCHLFIIKNQSNLTRLKTNLKQIFFSSFFSLSFSRIRFFSYSHSIEKNLVLFSLLLFSLSLSLSLSLFLSLSLSLYFSWLGKMRAGLMRPSVRPGRCYPTETWSSEGQRASEKEVRKEENSISAVASTWSW